MSQGELKISMLSGNQRRAYTEGYLAYGSKTVGDNPFDESSPYHWDWFNGWTQAGMDRIQEETCPT